MATELIRLGYHYTGRRFKCRRCGKELSLGSEAIRITGAGDPKRVHYYHREHYLDGRGKLIFEEARNRVLVNNRKPRNQE